MRILVAEDEKNLNHIISEAMEDGGSGPGLNSEPSVDAEFPPYMPAPAAQSAPEFLMTA